MACSIDSIHIDLAKGYKFNYLFVGDISELLHRLLYGRYFLKGNNNVVYGNIKFRIPAFLAMGRTNTLYIHIMKLGRSTFFYLILSVFL